MRALFAAAALTTVLAAPGPASARPIPTVTRGSLKKHADPVLYAKGIACHGGFRKAKLKIRISSGAHAVNLELGDPCFSWNLASVDKPGWRVTTKTELGEYDQDWPNVTIHVRPRRSGRQIFRYTATIDDSLVAQETLSVRSTVHRGSRVFQGTDDFVNYCINDDRPIYSANEQLYCIVPGYAETTWKKVSGSFGIPAP